MSESGPPHPPQDDAGPSGSPTTLDHPARQPLPSGLSMVHSQSIMAGGKRAAHLWQRAVLSHPGMKRLTLFNRVQRPGKYVSCSEKAPFHFCSSQGLLSNSLVLA